VSHVRLADCSCPADSSNQNVLGPLVCRIFVDRGRGTRFLQDDEIFIEDDEDLDARGLQGAAALAHMGMIADRRRGERNEVGSSSEGEVSAPATTKPSKKRKKRAISTPSPDDNDEEADEEYEVGLRRLRFKTPESIRRRLSDSRRALEAVGNSPFGRATMAFIEANSDKMVSHLSTIRSEARKHQVSKIPIFFFILLS
jgi:hypothetical protein